MNVSSDNTQLDTKDGLSDECVTPSKIDHAKFEKGAGFACCQSMCIHRARRRHFV